MIKFLFKVIFISVFLFGIISYANYLHTGTSPNIDISNSALPEIDLSEIKDSISDKLGSAKNAFESEDTESYLYKWRDENDVIHYTSEKPAENVKNLESIKISNQTNVVPSVSDLNNTTTQDNSQQQQNSSSLDSPLNVYTPEGIKELFDQAKDVQNMVNDQYSQQENIINQN